MGWSKYHSWDAKALGAVGLRSSLRRWFNHTLRRYFRVISEENPVVAGHLQLRFVLQYIYSLIKCRRPSRKAFGGPSFANLALSSSVPNLVNTFFGLEYAQAVPPHYTLVGPILSREAEAQAIGLSLASTTWHPD